MNLTYDFDESFIGSKSPECCSACHLSAAMGLTSPKAKMAQYVAGDKVSAALSGFFQDLANTVKTSIVRTNLFPVTLTKALVSGGPSAALQAVKNEGHAAAADIAPIAKPIGAVVSIFNPLIGGAIGAAGVAASADVAKQKAAQQQAASQAAGTDPGALLADYKQYMGQVPGRAFGVDLMLQVLRAGFQTGELKGFNGKPVAPSGADFIFYQGGFSGCAAWDQFVQQQVKQGVTTGQQVWNNWSGVTFDGGGTCGSNAPWNTSLGRQIAIDSFDALVAKYLPPPQAAPAPAPVAVTPTSPPPVLTTTAPATSAPAPVQPSATPSQAIQSTGLDPAVSAQIAAMLQAMQQQGANQAQMNSALMSALAQQGVNTSTPAVQQAAQVATQPQTAGLSNVPGWLVAAGAGLALMFALAMPHGKGGRSRAFSSQRKRNPRRRRHRR